MQFKLFAFNTHLKSISFSMEIQFCSSTEIHLMTECVSEWNEKNFAEENRILIGIPIFNQKIVCVVYWNFLHLTHVLMFNNLLPINT